MNDSFCWMLASEVQTRAKAALAAAKKFEEAEWARLIAKRRARLATMSRLWFWVKRDPTDQEIKSWYAGEGIIPRPWNWSQETRCQQLLQSATVMVTGAEMLVSVSDFRHLMMREPYAV